MPHEQKWVCFLPRTVCHQPAVLPNPAEFSYAKNNKQLFGEKRFLCLMKKDVMIVTGTGQTSMAITRRIGFGKKIMGLDYYIKDVIFRPEYQGNGIGRIKIHFKISAD